jgi:hypothetical protein
MDERDSPRITRRLRPFIVLGGTATLAVIVSVVANTPFTTTLGAFILALVIFRSGWFFLQSMATPPPPPPEPGTLRRVRLTYRCSVCGTEVRMTAANDEEPEPPRHCMDDMELVAPID